MSSGDVDLRGSDLPRAYIRGAIARGRLAHAYLLLGPDPSPQREFALELARILFCARPDASGAPCLACGPCRAIAHGNHRSVTIYRPQEGKSAIDIATVREIGERSHMARDEPYVAIIEAADEIQDAAANALLKTLEEPASDFILVLLAASAGSLLPTIVSRCHRLYFGATFARSSGSIVEDVFQEIFSDGFLAARDLKEWLADLVPGESTNRDRVRVLVAELIGRWRDSLADARGERLDLALARLDSLFELQSDIAGSVQADLVLERVLELLDVRVPAAPPHASTPRRADR